MLGGFAVATILISFIIIFIFHYRNKQLQHFKEKEQLKLHHEGELLRAQIEIGEETLKNISSEIHDNILQRLSLAKMYLSADWPAKSEKMNIAQEMLDLALVDLRNLSRSLSGGYILDLGIERAIQQELINIESVAGISTSYLSNGEPDDDSFSEQREIILFRCIQEGLQNAIKHSNANKVDVVVNHLADRLELSVIDNGIGIDLSNNTAGMGLRSMRDRTALLGGNFDICTEIDKGTELKFRIPHDSLKTILKNFEKRYK